MFWRTRRRPMACANKCHNRHCAIAINELNWTIEESNHRKGTNQHAGTLGDGKRFFFDFDYRTQESLGQVGSHDVQAGPNLKKKEKEWIHRMNRIFHLTRLLGIRHRMTSRLTFLHSYFSFFRWAPSRPSSTPTRCPSPAATSSTLPTAASTMASTSTALSRIS